MARCLRRPLSAEKGGALGISTRGMAAANGSISPKIGKGEACPLGQKYPCRSLPMDRQVGPVLGMRLLKKRGSDLTSGQRPAAMTVADLSAAGRNQVPLGIAYMVGSTAMFAGGNAVVKWQLATYPLGEVAFGRTLFSLLTVAAIVLPRTGWVVLRTRRYREHLQRGLSQFGSMLCWLLAISVLSLGSATAIGFAAPLFTTLLSI